MRGNMDFAIEKNIPLPKVKRGGKWEPLVNRMEPGDSILIPKNKVTGLRFFCKKTSCEIMTRKEDNDYMRVWLVKKYGNIRRHQESKI